MLRNIFDWSEVWAPVIPLFAYLLCKNKGETGVIFVFTYTVIAIILNGLADVVWHFNHLMPSWIQSNNVFYNIHSIMRCSIFSLLFIKQADDSMKKRIYRFLLCLYFLFVIINFTTIQSILFFSSYIFSAEGILLLIRPLIFLFFYFILH